MLINRFASRKKALLTFGAPGAGKRTQAERIVKADPTYFVIETGECCRGLRINDEDFRKQFDEEWRATLVPDDIIVSRIAEPKFREYQETEAVKPNLLLDGIPRTVNQIGYVIGKLRQHHFEDIVIVYYDATQSLCYERVTGRGREGDIIDFPRRWKMWETDTVPAIAEIAFKLGVPMHTIYMRDYKTPAEHYTQQLFPLVGLEWNSKCGKLNHIEIADPLALHA